MDVAKRFRPNNDCPVKVIDPRQCARRVVRISAAVADKLGFATCVVTNISEAGCELQLGTLFLLTHYLTLTLYPHHATVALQIALAKIRWIERGWAGVEFVTLSEQDRGNLQRLCREPVVRAVRN
jgi:PilZ domain-containing protein